MSSFKLAHFKILTPFSIDQTQPTIKTDDNNYDKPISVCSILKCSSLILNINNPKPGKIKFSIAYILYTSLLFDGIGNIII